MPQYEIDETGMAVPTTFNAEATVARAHGEAQVYSLLNPYLTDNQKAIIEAWFQIPGLVFYYIFIGSLLFKPDLLVKPVFLAIYASLIAGFAITRLSAGSLRGLIICVSYANNFFILIGIGITAIITKSASWGSALGALLVFLATVSPGNLYARCWAECRHPRMINKYGAAKEIFGATFPFEKYLDQSDGSKKMAQSQVMGQKLFALILVILLIYATARWAMISS